MKIVAVRHGETEGNVRQIAQSHAPGELTANGIRQAQELARNLLDERFDFAYSSDLKRAFDTALLITELHPGLKIKTTPLLRERSLGMLDGNPYHLIPPEFYDVSRLDALPEDGESLRDVIVRIISVLNDMYAKHSDATILLVSHGWTLKIMRSLLTDVSLQDSWSTNIVNASAQIWYMTDNIDIT